MSQDFLCIAFRGFSALKTVVSVIRVSSCPPRELCTKLRSKLISPAERDFWYCMFTLYLYTHACVYIHIYVHTHVCVYTYIYTHISRESDLRSASLVARQAAETDAQEGPSSQSQVAGDRGARRHASRGPNCFTGSCVRMIIYSVDVLLGANEDIIHGLGDQVYCHVRKRHRRPRHSPSPRMPGAGGSAAGGASSPKPGSSGFRGGSGDHIRI